MKLTLVVEDRETKQVNFVIYQKVKVFMEKNKTKWGDGR